LNFKEGNREQTNKRGLKVSYILDEKKGEAAAETVAAKPSKPLRSNKPEDESEPEPNQRISELEEELKQEKEKSEDFLHRLQYLQADFENYRKRIEREMWDAKRFGNERLLSDLLLVKDELELAYAKAQESEQNPVLLEGVGMIMKRLQAVLSKEGVEKIPGEGSKFNPDYHEAALKVPSKEEEGTVVEEVRSGYLLKGRVLRPSIVKVAEKQTSEETQSV
jgi:molecular chaperone GrpE